MSEDDLEIPAQLKNTDAANYLRQQKRRRFLQLSGLGALGAAGASYYWLLRVPPLHYDGRYAHATMAHPQVVQRAVREADELVDKPYKLGGGHSTLIDSGYD